MKKAPPPDSTPSLEQFYRELFSQARQQPVKVTCKSEKQARRLRTNLYRFRKALSEAPSADPELALAVPLARLSVRGKVLSVSYPDPEEKPNARTRIHNAANAGDA